jgi:glutathione synthase
VNAAVVTNGLRPGRTASSTVELIRIGLERGHAIWVADPESLAYTTACGVRGELQPVVNVSPDGSGSPDMGPSVDREFAPSDFDALLLRIQPPFDMAYFTACRILERVESQFVCLNRPSAIIAHPEKLAMLSIPEHHPSTVVSRNRRALDDFAQRHDRVVVKPLYDFQGRGVMSLRYNEPNYSVALDLLEGLYDAPMVMQEHLPAAAAGDKRVFVLDGLVIGSINRVPSGEGHRANLHAGGVAERAVLSEDEQRVTEIVAATLREAGLTFVGLDMIGGRVTEISTTSPTGFVDARDLAGAEIATSIWAWIEARVAERPPAEA